MSLLLDALKKAELAKQIATAESSASEQAGDSEPALDGPATRAITTREKLPDITQPLEILSDDLPSSEQKPADEAASRPELSLQEPEPFVPAMQAPPAVAGSGVAGGGRAQAEQIFQVKEMDYNPRRPFYLTLAALAVVAIGYGTYVWWQMQPHYSIPPAAAATPVSQAAVAAVTNPAPAIPVAPSQAPPPATAAPAGPAVAVIPPIQPVRSRPRSRATEIPGPSTARAQNPLAPDSGSSQAPIAVNAPLLSVDPAVEQGYRAFQRNDFAGARESYQKALAREPNNRDALLGLAAIDVRTGQLEAAEARYLKLLEIDPRDGQAVAALVGLRGRLDPVASESRLKTLIANQPEVPQLYFSLGNQYGQQSRWSEAQAAYFKAYSIDPQNADYAFNLAVSLDQLRQKKTALEYYQRALALAGNHAASFDAARRARACRS